MIQAKVRPPGSKPTAPTPTDSMKIDPQDFQVKGGKKIRLKHWPTAMQPYYKSERDYQKLLAGHVKELSLQQRLLYASGTYAVLLIFQALDAAGKDGAIAHVLTGVNPEGCEVFSFKQPSAEELTHDFLWRAICRLPARGRLGIFNRSYYEEVLVVRVHPELLRGQGIPPALLDPKAVWRERYRSMVELEKHLHRNGTRVVKFFLHLSKREQRKRFLARVDEPDKNWKFSQADLAERKFWDQYTAAYEDCLSATSTKASPWHVVPADDKDNARLIISRIVIEALQDLRLDYPKVSRAREREFKLLRKRLK